MALRLFAGRPDYGDGYAGGGPLGLLPFCFIGRSSCSFIHSLTGLELVMPGPLQRMNGLSLRLGGRRSWTGAMIVTVTVSRIIIGTASGGIRMIDGLKILRARIGLRAP